VPKLTLGAFGKVEPELQARIVEVLTQRPAWSKQLLEEIGSKKIPSSALNVNQLRKLQASKDRDLAAMVLKYWGTVREERSPEREKVVGQMRKLLGEKRGDAVAGKAVFTKNCAVCHKMHGEGQEVGPDLLFHPQHPLLAAAGIDQDAQGQRQVGLGGEVLDGLRQAVFIQAKIVFREILYNFALFVAHIREHGGLCEIARVERRARDVTSLLPSVSMGRRYQLAPTYRPLLLPGQPQVERGERHR
jgi:hypothetical protein